MLLNLAPTQAQDSLSRSFWQPAAQAHRPRLVGLSTGLATGFGLSLLALNQAWYAQYARSRFHTFNDWAGWRQMDKAGHAFSTYFEARLTGELYQWAGLPQKKAAAWGAGLGLLFQSGLETLDGFSSAWGFSWGDMAFNGLGAGLYLGQALGWKEQRILLKMSLHRPNYATAPLYDAHGSNAQSSLEQRAASLYGRSLPQMFIKEYNGQTIWLSFNLAAFSPERPAWLPPWLNLSLGYGIENVFGAERNAWTEGEAQFIAPAAYPRYSQYYLSLDVDFQRIKTKKAWLKGLFSVLNLFKLPFPALEYRSMGGFRGHWLHF